MHEYVSFLEQNVQPYAYIIQDLGLAIYLKTNFPNIIMHASTQMQQHSSGAVSFLKNLGFSRIVMAREASAKNIQSLCESGIECEVFVHGALCVCMSGGCLMSSMIGKRSGNKGECAQPCRLKYEGKNAFPLSPKDLCLAGHIPELIEMGVTSFKIEGRMKSPDYVYAVTSIYHKLIDENRNATDEEITILRNIFSRGGFTDGYFTDKPGNSMFGVRSQADKKLSKSVKLDKLPISPRPPLEEISKNSLSLPLVLPLKDSLKVIPPIHQKGFVFRFDCKSPGMNVIKKCYDLALRIDLPVWDIEKLDGIEKYADKISVILPRTIYDSDSSEIRKFLGYAKTAGITQATVSNVAHLSICNDFFIHGDYSLNVLNSKTLALLENLSLSSAMLSPESSPKHFGFSPLAKEYIVYGRIPLMQTENCILKNLGAYCRENCAGTLIDRTKAVFPVKREYKHRNIIYNSVPIYLADKIKELKKSGVGIYTLLFIDEYENQREFDKLIALCSEKGPAPFTYTRGYYK